MDVQLMYRPGGQLHIRRIAHVGMEPFDPAVKKSLCGLLRGAGKVRIFTGDSNEAECATCVRILALDRTRARSK